MKFDRDSEGSYQAHVKAEVGPDSLVKSYDWIIKDAPAKQVKNCICLIQQSINDLNLQSL